MSINIKQVFELGGGVGSCIRVSHCCHLDVCIFDVWRADGENPSEGRVLAALWLCLMPPVC